MAELWDVLDKDRNFTGRLHKRGWLKPGDYHLIVHVWIVNEKGEFLISQRSSDPKRRWPGKWACTKGSAVAGDDSLTTALKETREELGIILGPDSGQLFAQFRRDNDDGSGRFIDAWLFRQEVDIATVVFQPEETCDAMWASKSQIKKMMETGDFVPEVAYPYLDVLFELCEG